MDQISSLIKRPSGALKILTVCVYRIPSYHQLFSTKYVKNLCFCDCLLKKLRKMILIELWKNNWVYSVIP